MAVATANASIAEDEPIHSNPDASFRWPELAAMLNINNGTNTRKPHAALSPTPTQRLRTDSMPRPPRQKKEYEQLLTL